MKITIGALALGLAASLAAAQTSPAVDAKGAFGRLTALQGEWKGTAERVDGPPVSVVFQVVSGGSVVEEIQFAGTPHEMRSLYHMDGKDLVLTHYCALGNQPKMRLAGDRASDDEVVFDFAGGTNFDPAKDLHVHAGRIHFMGADRLESEWFMQEGAKPVGSRRFLLQRAR
jgi:hypothetical protein